MTAGGAEGLRVAVEALADEWEQRANEVRVSDFAPRGLSLIVHAEELRALLVAQSGPEVVGGPLCFGCGTALRYTTGVGVKFRTCDTEACPGNLTAHDDPTPADPRGGAAGLEAVLAGHRLTTPVQCACGWRETDHGAGTWAAHLAAVIVEAGWKR